MNEQNTFEKINNWIRNVEGSVVNLLSSIAPWGAPLPAAYMSFTHMDTVLKFPVIVSVPVAAVIEILGFATVSTILSFWSHNRHYTDETKQAPIGLTIAAFVFYLAIVLTMNVLIDATTGTSSAGIAIIAVRALLTLMSIPAALVLAVRTQHHEMLNDFDDKKRERAFKRQYGDSWFEMMYGKPSSGSSPSSQRTREPSEKSLEVKQFISAYFENNNKVPSLQEIMNSNKVVKSYASTLRSEWIKEHPEITVRKEE